MMEPPEVVHATLTGNYVMTREELEDTIASAITSHSRYDNAAGLSWSVRQVMIAVDDYIAELNKESREEIQDSPLP